MSEPQNPEAPQYRDEVPETALPDKLAKLYNKAESAYELRNWGYAVSLLQAVLAQEPGFLKGRKMLRAAAIKDTQGKKSIKLGGEAIKVAKLQGQAKKDPIGVLVALEKEVLAADPYNPQANELFYEAASAAGLKMTAGNALETVIQGHPDNTKFFHKLGDFYMENEAFEKAAEIFKQIVAKDSADLQASKKYKDATARGSIASQKWDSEGDWRDLLKDKDAANSLEKEGKAAMTPDMLQAQAARLTAEYEADQNNIEVVKQLAGTYEQLEDFATACSFFEWAFHLSSNDPALERKVALMREKVGKQQQKDLVNFIKENPEHPDIEQYKAQLAELKKGQLEELIKESEARVARNPTDTELRFELGDRLFQGERYRDAIQHLQQAKNSPNLRLKVMNMLGKCYDKMGMTDLAAKQFEEAISELTGMDDTKKDALYNLALLYEKMDNKEKYLNSLKEIYAVDYGYRDVAARVEGSYGDE
ncbi:MAG: tetratricopeptide repeat protein [Verrucomicrobiales bacterium]|nr:tetratricopeptide repeat protein [Verrucomicrobiales bacterium]